MILDVRTGQQVAPPSGHVDVAGFGAVVQQEERVPAPDDLDVVREVCDLALDPGRVEGVSDHAPRGVIREDRADVPGRRRAA